MVNLIEKIKKGQISFIDGITGQEVTDSKKLAEMIQALINLQLFYEKIAEGNNLRAS